MKIHRFRFSFFGSYDDGDILIDTATGRVYRCVVDDSGRKIEQIFDAREWIPVSDGLPPIDERVMVAPQIEIMRRHAQEGYWDWDGDIEPWPVTHWMPLPQRPAQ